MNFSHVLTGLRKADIDYVLVGGLAVFLNGINRATLDIDIVIAMNDANLTRFIDFAKKLGLKPRIPVSIESLKSAGQIEQWCREKGMIAFSLVSTEEVDLSIDVLVKPVVPFEELKAGARQIVFSGGHVTVASPAHLIRLKQNTGRGIDARDIILLTEHFGIGEEGKSND